MTYPLALISDRASANAESLVRFDKDSAAALRDARFDMTALMGQTSRGRLFKITHMLIHATQLAAHDDLLEPEARLTLIDLAAWVRKEQRVETRAAEALAPMHKSIREQGGAPA